MIRLILLLAFVSPAFAAHWNVSPRLLFAIAHVADAACQGTGSSTSFTSSALSINPTAGNTMLLGIRIGGGTAPTVTVTSSPSGTWTQDNTMNANAQGAGYDFTFRSSNVTGGSTTITVAINTAATSIRFCPMEISGLDNTSPLDKTAANAGSSGNPSSGATATTTVADELVFGVDANSNGGSGTITAGSGYTLGSQLTCSTVSCLAVEYKIISSTGAQTCTFTDPQAWGCQCSTYKIASSGATVPTGPWIIR